MAAQRKPIYQTMSEPTKYLVGIDLGTSNCAVAFVDPSLGAQAPVIDFPILQIQRPGETAALPLLPSCLYLPGEHELPEGSTYLPWNPAPQAIMGELARWQGARVPGRFVSSSKSWLCHPGVDRTAPILPWGAPADVTRLSPVEASARLLEHMRQAWDYAHPGSPLAEQEVIITVPASFDEAARSLTVTAARNAHLEKFTLLEEPQAAFYDFTSHHRRQLTRALENIRLVLVVDVGGGTSDFTLVQVGASEEGPLLRRIAVGEHLMLGGDNMDAALARKAEERMVLSGRKLSTAQWTQLVQGARVAKEKLLSADGSGEFNLAVTAEGSRLIGGSLSVRITRAEAEAIVLDGFLPVCGPEEEPKRAARVALQEVGLPYVQDPAITRHLAAFIRAHAAAGRAALSVEAGLPRPDAILLNGGVFNSNRLSERLVKVVSSWWPEYPEIPQLPHQSLDLAVARGAAFYGLVRHGLGRRISGGSAHALYMGLEKAGAEAPMAICVVPRGQEEGETIDLGERVFQLNLGRPVRFPLYSTASDRLEKSGEVVPVSEDMHTLPPIHTLLKGSGGKTGAVPVHLRSTLTEIGTLELWCVSNSSNESWRLEFELRGGSTDGQPTVTESMPSSFAEARIWVERIYGGKPKPVSALKGTPPKEPKHLWNSLESSLGAREQWRPALLRELWGALYAGAPKRRRSPAHERVFYQLLGYTLRPGFGYPLDDWRAEQSARLFEENVQFHKEKSVWVEYWVMWRRIAGGLTQERQRQIWAYLKPHLASRIPPSPPKHHARPKGVQPEGLDEMVRLAAALEHLEIEEKLELGDWIASRLFSASSSGPWAWALGRIGARAPIYGSVHRTIPPDKAAEWVDLLAQPAQLRLEGTVFAVSQLARMTGDRARDLDARAREMALQALQSAKAPASWLRLVTEVSVLEEADRARALGDTLPVGLCLVD
jgi:molecular chaperone DnaK (HSP70)